LCEYSPMSSVRSLASAGIVLVLPAVISVSGGPITARGQQRLTPKPFEITTDTREYCLHLLDRVSDLVRLSAEPIPPEVTSLSAEGEQLCDHGQPKGGILRLRRALLMMEQGGSAAYR
jgi:hypothetical protein